MFTIHFWLAIAHIWMLLLLRLNTPTMEKIIRKLLFMEYCNVCYAVMLSTNAFSMDNNAKSIEHRASCIVTIVTSSTRFLCWTRQSIQSKCWSSSYYIYIVCSLRVTGYRHDATIYILVTCETGTIFHKLP